MRVLVTGANGMLGSEVCFSLISEGHRVFMTDIIKNAQESSLRYLDICDFASVKSLINELNPEMIMHLAAETDVDRCEIEKDRAFIINSHATRNIAEICREKNIVLVYISTGFVFDGEKKSPYTEKDKPNQLDISVIR